MGEKYKASYLWLYHKSVMFQKFPWGEIIIASRAKPPIDLRERYVGYEALISRKCYIVPNCYILPSLVWYIFSRRFLDAIVSRTKLVPLVVG